MANQTTISFTVLMTIFLFGCATAPPKDETEAIPTVKKELEEEKVLSESERREIFKEIIQTEDRATKRAQRRFPSDLKKHIDLERELQEKYKDKLAKRHDLTRVKLHAIGAEGLMNNWPTSSLGSKLQMTEGSGVVAKKTTSSGQAIRNKYLTTLRKMGVDESLVLSVARGLDDYEVRITVSISWHYFPYQVRLDAAQNLWNIWAAIRSPSDPDRARIELVSLNGNKVGGSRWLAGSLIWVQKD